MNTTLLKTSGVIPRRLAMVWMLVRGGSLGDEILVPLLRYLDQ